MALLAYLRSGAPTTVLFYVSARLMLGSCATNGVGEYAFNSYYKSFLFLVPTFPFSKDATPNLQSGRSESSALSLCRCSTNGRNVREVALV